MRFFMTSANGHYVSDRESGTPSTSGRDLQPSDVGFLARHFYLPQTHELAILRPTNIDEFPNHHTFDTLELRSLNWREPTNKSSNDNRNRLAKKSRTFSSAHGPHFDSIGRGGDAALEQSTPTQILGRGNAALVRKSSTLNRQFCRQRQIRFGMHRSPRISAKSPKPAVNTQRNEHGPSPYRTLRSKRILIPKTNTHIEKLCPLDEPVTGLPIVKGF